LNILSLVLWILSLAKRRRVGTVKRYLKISTPTTTEKEPLVSSSSPTTTLRTEPYGRRADYVDFADYLHADGFLIFELFARNTDDLVAGQIIEHLYRNFTPPNRNYMSNV
jgi:hypothetical protein